MTLQLRGRKVTLLESPGKVFFFFLLLVIGSGNSPIQFRFRNYISKMCPDKSKRYHLVKTPPKRTKATLNGIMSHKRLITDQRFSKHFHHKTNHQVSLVKLLQMEVAIIFWKIFLMEDLESVCSLDRSGCKV